MLIYLQHLQVHSSTKSLLLLRINVIFQQKTNVNIKMAEGMLENPSLKGLYVNERLTQRFCFSAIDVITLY